MLIAHREIRPSEDLKQLAATPQVAPTIAFEPAWLDNE
jgi:hypothetical protein